MDKYFHWKDRTREYEKQQKDVTSTILLLKDAKHRYIKEKTRAKSKKQAEDMKAVFAELEQYNYSYSCIQEVYGYGGISYDEFKRLTDLLERKEKYVTPSFDFKDDVSDLLDRAITYIANIYEKEWEEYEQDKKDLEEHNYERMLSEWDYEK